MNHTRIAVVGTLVVMTIFAAYIAYQALIRPMLVGWPVTVDSAADRVISLLPEQEKVQLASAKKEDLIRYHFGLGMYIRNEFGLWHGNYALLWSACGDCAPDDASMIIIERSWTKLREGRR